MSVAPPTGRLLTCRANPVVTAGKLLPIDYSWTKPGPQKKIIIKKNK